MDNQSGELIRVSHSYDNFQQTIFDAWLDSGNAVHWLFATPDGDIVHAEIDARVGGKFLIRDRRKGVDIDHIGEYTAIDRPARLAFKYSAPRLSPGESLVTIDFAARGDGCDITLTQHGVPAGRAADMKQAWETILHGLEDMLRWKAL